MKNSIKPIIWGAFALALLTTTSQGTVIFTDTFDSGTGSWFKAGTENTLSNSSGQLSWSSGNTGTTDAIRQVIGRNFGTQTLNVGETIRLTLDYTQDSATTGNLLRVGLYDVGTQITGDGWSTSETLIGTFAGYTGFIRDSATTSTIRTDSGTDTSATNTGPTIAGTQLTTIAGTGTTFDILASTQYKVIFELTRTSATQMDAIYRLASFDGLTTHQNITGSTTIVQGDFDTVVLRSIVPSLFDNVQLEIIPEPSAALLGGLGLLALLRRRR